MKDQGEKSGRKGKRSGKPHYKVNESKIDRTIVDGSNDAHWYGTDEVLRLAGNISFFKALGLPIDWAGTAVTHLQDKVPGIMALRVVDSLPVGRSGTNAAVEPINIAARQQYALIRKANAGAKNYEWNDLIIYELARSSINQVFAFITRAYGVARTYSMQNRYLPKALLTTMGFDADDFISNLASIRLWLNNFALRANTLALPHSLSYFERKAWLYSNIYVDGNAAKAQVYFLTPAQVDGDDAGFFVYDPTVSTNGGCVRRAALFGNGTRFSDWSLVADNWLAILLSDDDCAIISGDILKAYGDNNLFKCNPIPEDFTITPIYNAEVLSQFENSIAVGSEPTALSSDTGDDILLHSGAIMQDGSGNLLYDPYFDTNFGGSVAPVAKIEKACFNFHHTDVTPPQVMVGSRLITLLGIYHKATGGSGNFFQSVRTCGTEIISDYAIVLDPSGSALTYHSFYYNMSVNYSHLMMCSNFAVFDWAPKLYLHVQSQGAIRPIGELATYRMLEESEVAKLHDTATIYMFGVPLIESYNK